MAKGRHALHALAMMEKGRKKGKRHGGRKHAGRRKGRHSKRGRK